ncbi:hypothetical protein GA0061078_1503 [Bifidobacterium bohemicum]|uniref:Uncharacterized protein n=1 Tax=Bifidobacterium bohemicum DSM 22767 TaxID=1437606 RepID=A0A086ZGX4_9BIFI|nr:hypothetical protein [Bifidobacterium bohemicum]KFI45774.1 hypothetical protein BBOH_0576 [Bifidobacterium bohemicum DSM 22767]SCC11435.1 hypothetical protein GA0061078_1503 [Bifidobacterium bohemicum]
MTSQKPAKRKPTKRKPSKQMRRVYLRRRIVVGVAAVLVLAVLAFCVYNVGRFAVIRMQGGGSDTSQTSARRNDGKSKSQQSGKSSKSGKSSNADGSGNKRQKAETTKKSGVKECGANDVRLELASKSQNIAVGGTLDFTATIRYEGSSSCLIDASNSSRVLTITSGDDTIWRSDSCPADQRQLLMAKGDKDVQTLTWNADRTGSGCQPDENLLRVNAGTYMAQLSLKDHPKVKSEKVPVVVEGGGQEEQ